MSTAVGTCFVPSFANVTVGLWEEGVMNDSDMTENTEHIVVWLRYINDSFIIWLGSEEALKTFMIYSETTTWTWILPVPLVQNPLTA